MGWAVGDVLWRQSGRPLDVPSARYIWQAAKEMDNEKRPTTLIAGAGTSLRAALAVVKRYGYALESEISSDTNDLYPSSADSFHEIIASRKTAAIVNLGTDAKCWLAWLSLGRPIALSIWAGRNFASNQDEVIGDYNRNEDGQFAHAAVVVGFRFLTNEEPKQAAKMADADKDLPFRVQYLIRNSAGTEWGDGGYGWLDHRNMALQAAEGYGLLWSGESIAPEAAAKTKSTATAAASRARRRTKSTKGTRIKKGRGQQRRR